MDLSTFGKIIAGGKDLDCIQVGGEKIWEASRVRSIFGNAKQDGTPTSLVPIPYSSVGDLGDDGRYHIGVRVFSPNFFDKDTIVWEDGKYLIYNGGFTNHGMWSTTDYIPISGKQFEFYRDTTTGNAPAICLYDAEKNFLCAKKYEYAETIYISAGDLGVAAYARFSVFHDQKDRNATLRAYDDQDIILSEPLRKVGEFADEFTPEGVIRRVLPWALDGTSGGHEAGGPHSLGGGITRYVTPYLLQYIPNLRKLSNGRSVIASDQYVFAETGNGIGTMFMHTSNTSNARLYFIHQDQTLTTPEEMNAQLQIDKATVYIPIEDTLDTDFVWERPIYVEPGQTVRVLTALQPSDTKIG